MLKLGGLGFKDYFGDSYNIFDFFVILVSTADLVFSYLKVTKVREIKAVQTLRAIRLLRVFKLAKSWRTLHY
jgi:hypothetical protein